MILIYFYFNWIDNTALHHAAIGSHLTGVIHFSNASNHEKDEESKNIIHLIKSTSLFINIQCIYLSFWFSICYLQKHKIIVCKHQITCIFCSCLKRFYWLGFIALQGAAVNGQEIIIDYLIQHGVCIHRKNIDGKNIFYIYLPI